MNQEPYTPRTDNALSHDGNWDTKALRMANLARQLERELNDAMAALRNLTDEISRHEGASMMHPRLTRAIAAANRLTTEKNEK